MKLAAAAGLLAVLGLAQDGDGVAFHEARVRSRPGDVDALKLLADSLIARAEATASGVDYDRAAQALDQADRFEPWYEATVLSRCRLLNSRHRFLAARGLAEEGARRFPKQPGFLEIAGDAALELGDLESAERHYRKLIGMMPLMSSWARLAHVYEAREDWAKAHQYQTKALESTFTGRPAPMESRAWCRAILGEIELRSGNAAKAREQYLKGLEDAPDHPLVLEHFAELEALEGNKAAAKDKYRRILAKQRNPAIELRLAELAAGTEGETLRARAVEYLEKAVASGNEGFLRPLAEARLAQRRYEEAAELQVRDVLLRPVADACEVLARIEREAKAAGTPVKQTGLGICARSSLEFNKPLK